MRSGLRSHRGLCGWSSRLHGLRAPLQSGRKAQRIGRLYSPVARFNTVRGKLGSYLFELPLAVSVQDGYMNSLARYHKRRRSFGIELRTLKRRDHEY
jgi:hypothetical protein